ncbi:MAG: bacterioferritin [Anaerolineae bacterium]|nr:bacterioferritin [Anaerolineae bacterium]
MKGNDQLLTKLNELLADELGAINQYMVHSEMAADWGYEKLHEFVEKRAMEEMRHAETLIGRILFLEGRPIVTKLSPIYIGSTVPEQIEKDHAAELAAIRVYNEAIDLAVAVKDNGTREILEGILKDEEMHIDGIESQQDLIEQIGLENYLVEQIH